MNKHFLSLLFLLCISFSNEYSQNIDTLFDSLNTPRGWEKSMKIDTLSPDSLYGFATLAQIRLKNETRNIEIVVLEKGVDSVLNDQDFLNEEQDQNDFSSCRNFHSDNIFRLFSFTTKQYYIVPTLCPSCDFIKDRNCKKIKKSFHKWANLWVNY